MARRLLLADDSITIQKVVELVLSEEDFEIKSVNNGEDALNLIDTFKPDVVLADIEMPKINGYKLCEKIKQSPSTARVPVILLAGAFEPIDATLAREVGADDSVIKPFESHELISKINASLALSSAEVQEEPQEEELTVTADAEEKLLVGLFQRKTSGQWKKCRRCPRYQKRVFRLNLKSLLRKLLQKSMLQGLQWLVRQNLRS
jgi:DNA-binding response OmpR family regulator